MKIRNKIIVQSLALSVVLMAMTSCSNDDEDNPQPGPNNTEAIIRIIQVDPVNDQIILKNFGEASKDVGDYWICNLKSYAQVSDLASGDLNLDPNGTITLDRVIVDAASDIGLYNTNTFTDAAAMVDFMQFGEDVGANGRADVAAAKGIWTLGEFVAGGSPFDYSGNGSETGANSWIGAPLAPANIRIIKVEAADDKITLKNFGGTAQDVSSYWICNLKTYAQLDGLASGDLILDPDETIELDRPIDDTASDVGLYNTNAFTSVDAIVDFMQYGNDIAGDGRANVADDKGIWTEGDFVSGGSPYDYSGNGNENGANFWAGN
ncbi:MAG: hypothetical protein ACR2MX_05825 [Cyclobacteriaceae bacterium]